MAKGCIVAQVLSLRCSLFFTTQQDQYLSVPFLFSLVSDEPEVFLFRYSQTAILHAAHFRRVVKIQLTSTRNFWFVKMLAICILNLITMIYFLYIHPMLNLVYYVKETTAVLGHFAVPALNYCYLFHF